MRSADDILTFAKSKRQAKKLREIATHILEDELGLKVNEAKTRGAGLEKGVSYLGFVICPKYIGMIRKGLKNSRLR